MHSTHTYGRVGSYPWPLIIEYGRNDWKWQTLTITTNKCCSLTSGAHYIVHNFQSFDKVGSLVQLQGSLTEGKAQYGVTSLYWPTFISSSLYWKYYIHFLENKLPFLRRSTELSLPVQLEFPACCNTQSHGVPNLTQFLRYNNFFAVIILQLPVI
jgi:hypothetical protein